MSQQQTIRIPETSQGFLAGRIVSAANHQYPEKTQRLIGLQNSLSRKSSVSRKDSKTFSPAELSYQQIINIPEIFKGFFACRIVLAANHQYPEKIQRLFCLQNCLSCKSSLSRKHPKRFSLAELSQPQIITIPKKLKVFFACRIVLPANHQYPGNIQRFFRLQKCLSRKSSISGKYSKTFSPADLSQQQIIKIEELFKDFSRLQNCLSRKSSKSGNYSKTFLPVELAQPQITNIPEIFEDFFAGRIVLAANHRFPAIFKDFFACRFVLAANHQYPGNIRRLFRRQNCLSRKSSVSRNIHRIFRQQNCLSRKSSISRKYSKTFSHAELSYPQIINIPKILKDLLAC